MPIEDLQGRQFENQKSALYAGSVRPQSESNFARFCREIEVRRQAWKGRSLRGYAQTTQNNVRCVKAKSGKEFQIDFKSKRPNAIPSVVLVPSQTIDRSTHYLTDILSHLLKAEYI